MGNISKKTRKKINKILLSNHFKKKSGVTQDTLVYAEAGYSAEAR